MAALRSIGGVLKHLFLGVGLGFLWCFSAALADVPIGSYLIHAKRHYNTKNHGRSSEYVTSIVDKPMVPKINAPQPGPTFFDDTTDDLGQYLLIKGNGLSLAKLEGGNLVLLRPNRSSRVPYSASSPIVAMSSWNEQSVLCLYANGEIERVMSGGNSANFYLKGNPTHTPLLAQNKKVISISRAGSDAVVILFEDSLHLIRNISSIGLQMYIPYDLKTINAQQPNVVFDTATGVVADERGAWVTGVENWASYVPYAFYIDFSKGTFGNLYELPWHDQLLGLEYPTNDLVMRSGSQLVSVNSTSGVTTKDAGFFHAFNNGLGFPRVQLSEKWGQPNGGGAFMMPPTVTVKPVDLDKVPSDKHLDIASAAQFLEALRWYWEHSSYKDWAKIKSLDSGQLAGLVNTDRFHPLGTALQKLSPDVLLTYGLTVQNDFFSSKGKTPIDVIKLARAVENVCAVVVAAANP